MLARIEIEHADHGGAENGKLPVTFDDFQKYGIHRHSIAPSMRALEALGFLEITERGRAGNAEWRRPHVFRLTYVNTTSAGPTEDWRKIEDLEHAESIAAAARKNRSPVAKSAKFQCRKSHHKQPSHSAGTVTTTQGTETATTFYISGGMAVADGARPIQRPARPDAGGVGEQLAEERLHTAITKAGLWKAAAVLPHEAWPEAVAIEAATVGAGVAAYLQRIRDHAAQAGL